MNPTPTPTHNRTRPHKGRVSPRAIKTWKDAFQGHLHSAPDSNLPTTNLPAPTTPRFLTSLNAALVAYPHLESVWIEHWDIEDGQLATQPVNRPAAVHKIASDRFDATDIGSGLIP
jgi:hypothetical protein